MPKRSPRAGRASVLTLATIHRPAFAAATRAISGATARHGPHHGAQKSTITGRCESRMSASNDPAEDTSTGSAGAGIGTPQWPHFASRPKGTLLRLAQDGHTRI